MKNAAYLAKRAKEVRSRPFPSGTKICSKCGKEKFYAAFSPHGGCKDGYRPECKECHADYHRDSRRYRPEKNRQYELKKKFGISGADYDRLFSEQEGKCAICGDVNPGVGGRFKFFCVDHNHVDGRIRGLLCTRCNRGLGFFCDDISRLTAAAAYLRKYEAN